TAWPRSRSKNCGPIGPRRRNKPRYRAAGKRRAGRIRKRAARDCERPKSREETPKEGDGSGTESLATALQQHTPRRTKYKSVKPPPPSFSPKNSLQIVQSRSSLRKRAPTCRHPDEKK